MIACHSVVATARTLSQPLRDRLALGQEKIGNLGEPKNVNNAGTTEMARLISNRLCFTTEICRFIQVGERRVACHRSELSCSVVDI